MIPGDKARKKRKLRILGGVILLLGLAITAAMIYFIVWVADTMIHTGNPDATERFSGDAWSATFIFGLLGLLLLFGISS